MSCWRSQSTGSHQRCCFSLAGWHQGQHPVQGGHIFLSQPAEPSSSSAVVVLRSLQHAHPGLGRCISGLLAEHLPQMSARRLIITWSGIIATGLGGHWRKSRQRHGKPRTISRSRGEFPSHLWLIRCPHVVDAIWVLCSRPSLELHK